MPEQKQEGIRMLEIKEIWKTFNAGTVNEKQALRGVSLTLKDGDFCTVIGGNGAGSMRWPAPFLWTAAPSSSTGWT